MNITERHRHAKQRRTHVIAAAVIAASVTACSQQQPVRPPVTAGDLTDHDVVKLRALDPTVRPLPTSTARPKHRSTHHRPARIGTALTIRRLRVTAYCETGSRTFTGVWPKRGMAAVKRSTGIAFGSVLHVAGYRYVVTDREPEYGVSDVDLYAGYRPDCEQYAANFGIRHLPVTIEDAAA